MSRFFLCRGFVTVVVLSLSRFCYVAVLSLLRFCMHSLQHALINKNSHALQKMNDSLLAWRFEGKWIIVYILIFLLQMICEFQNIISLHFHVHRDLQNSGLDLISLSVCNTFFPWQKFGNAKLLLGHTFFSCDSIG